MSQAMDQEPVPYEDPGAVPYGNFPNYYSFNPPENRISLLTPGLLRKFLHASSEAKNQKDHSHPILAFDVGCNSGQLSLALYDHLIQSSKPSDGPSDDGPSDGPSDVHFLCCDIDADLISKAQASNPFPNAITYVTLDIMDSSMVEGPIHRFLDGLGQSTFNIGFCMSVTMWIHLNHGDEGLVEFLRRLTTLCDYLLIEPQPWKCYRSAARRLRKLGRQDFDHFHSLSIRGNMAKRITCILTREGNAELVHRFGKTIWDRSLLLFKINRST